MFLLSGIKISLFSGHSLEHFHTLLYGHERHATHETFVGTVDKHRLAGYVVSENDDNMNASPQIQLDKNIDDAHQVFPHGESPYNAPTNFLQIHPELHTLSNANAIK